MSQIELKFPQKFYAFINKNEYSISTAATLFISRIQPPDTNRALAEDQELFLFIRKGLADHTHWPCVPIIFNHIAMTEEFFLVVFILNFDFLRPYESTLKFKRFSSRITTDYTETIDDWTIIDYTCPPNSKNDYNHWISVILKECRKWSQLIKCCIMHNIDA